MRTTAILLVCFILAVLATPADASPQYTGQIRCAVSGCSSGVTDWETTTGGNRGYAIANATTGAPLPMVLIDDTDATRAADFKVACASGLYKVVMATIGQGESWKTRFSCPQASVLGLGLREWYPFWATTEGGPVTLQLPYSWFECKTLGWVSQSTGWGWGGFAGDNGSDPASPVQSASEFWKLTSLCPELGSLKKGIASGTEATF